MTENKNNETNCLTPLKEIPKQLFFIDFVNDWFVSNKNWYLLNVISIEADFPHITWRKTAHFCLENKAFSRAKMDKILISNNVWKEAFLFVLFYFSRFSRHQNFFLVEFVSTNKRKVSKILKKVCIRLGRLGLGIIESPLS